MHFIAAGALGLAAILVTLDVWKDIALTALNDEESGYILLMPAVIVWLVWVRRHRLSWCRPRGQWVGILLVAIGWLTWSYGYRSAQHTFWDAGAILVTLGACVACLGKDVLVEFLPAVVALAFLIPVWPVRRQQLAWPMQLATAKVTQAICEILNMNVLRQGNLLVSNGVDVAIAEACNGMRMVLTLLLVSYVYVFVTPLRTSVRLLILAISPLTSVMCNVIRLVPTVWVYGHASMQTAERFHDISGWIMLGVAFLLLIGIVRLLVWLGIPVMKPARTQREPVDRSSGLMEGSAALPAIGAPLLALALLVGMRVEAFTFAPPPDVAPYHQRIRDAAAQLPMKIQEWTGQEIALPYDVFERLRPNVLISRRYRNELDGREASLLFVQCQDARLLANHYPPACYGNEGYTQLSVEPRDWSVDDLHITGMEYEFARNPNGPPALLLANFLILPNGRFVRDIAPVNAAAADIRARFYGAAEVQIVFDLDTPRDQRDQIVGTFVHASRPLISAILRGAAAKTSG